MRYIAPEVFSKSFTCPHCGSITQHRWWFRNWRGGEMTKSSSPIRIGHCTFCEENTLWIEDKMYYPENGNSPNPNSEMPEPVKKLYLEAASIHTNSPRGAAALLRFAVQVLCKELDEPGTNINNDIASLVKKGLPILVQQSLDIVRVTGNNAVHPGQIDTDNAETVGKLFDLINIITEYMIALPKKVSGIYSELPENQKEAIAKRDKK